EINVAGFGTPELPEKIKRTRAFDAYLLAGGPEKPGKVTRGIYYKGELILLDGLFVHYAPVWKGLFQEGRFIAAHIRRGRSTPDLFAIESEPPVAWGTIEAIDGNTVTLAAPKIEGMATSGKQTLDIADDSEYFHLGLPIDRDKALNKGSLIRVFAPRPQTILVNDGVN
ncbi:MAG: hypothetical protein MI757_15405, partial [Pirellulales bacterium]|nr:hypothetical protein [Pirellulales bacterium]